ncbi:SCO family protein [Microbulbifer sp.]|uniref:SCO family protein n=1 Tax=Microbulbifer sp. TaxID=1908541 RepID=UPI003F3E4653
MRIIWALVSCLILCGFSEAHGSGEKNRIFKDSRPLPEFSLLDQHRKTYDLDRLKGRWALIFIGFTSCPDVCPVTLMKLEAVRAELGLQFSPSRIPEIVFLAVDPQRDAPVLAEYLAHFHPDNVGITGPTEQIDTLVSGIGGFYRLGKPGRGSAHYDVTHTAAIAVVNPKAELVAEISQPLDVQEVSEFLTHLIRRGKRP